MKKKILLITAFLALAMLVTPIMAAPATKIEGVTMIADVEQEYDPGFPHIVSHGTISHGKGIGFGTVILNIPGDVPLVLVGDWNSEWVSMGNWKKDPVVVVLRGKMVWTFDGGTFEGVIQRKIIGFPPDPPTIIPYFEDHLILRGTGDFQGQTLKLSYEGYPPVIAEGYIIIPK
jgi:hypothetical protein